jgi:Flp pilus assembly secretin CpaC
MMPMTEQFRDRDGPMTARPSLARLLLARLSLARLSLAILMPAAVSLAALGIWSAAMLPATATERLDAVAVIVDHAKVIKLPEKTQTVIVGNPMIADISVQKNGILIVTGKSFGVTNFIALDASGGMLAESRVTVRAATDAVVTVQRGMDRESYSCAPQCQPAIQLGDSAKFFGDVGGQASSRNQMSAPAR